ncbi:hypothetical protein CEXT_624591 [Caerostris extrusa]|uniref:Uncharacterized protein n=1 Tax=Caerostris extrusa TaxID=172846 RepID=A0AAV4YEP3_CAEEX|nr:hypothetical protein CEXT_624591 [Caerostris extrusa]
MLGLVPEGELRYRTVSPFFNSLRRQSEDFCLDVRAFLDSGSLGRRNEDRLLNSSVSLSDFWCFRENNGELKC